MIKKLMTKDIVISVIFGLIMALCYSLGYVFLKNKEITNMSYFLIGKLTIILAIPISILLFIFLIKFDSIINFIKNIKLFNKIESTNYKLIFILFAVLGFIIYIPPYLAVFPGYYSYDGPGQIIEFLNNDMGALQPILHTIILGSFFKLGESIGSYTVGFALYTLFQGILVILTFSYLAIFLLKRKVPTAIVVISFLFLTLNPIIQILSLSTIKDIIFSLLLMLFLLFNFDMIDNKDIFFKSKFLIARYIITGILMCLFRNQGIYVYTLTILIILFILKGQYWKKVLLSFFIILLCVLTFLGPISESLNVTPGPKKEMLSILIQQISRVYSKDPNNITDEEKTILFEYIPEKSFEKYIPEISDLIKADFNEDKFKEDKADFIKIYLQIGLRNFNTYVEAFLYETVGYFYPDTASTMTPYSVLAEYQNNPFYINIEQHSLFSLYNKYLKIIGNNFLKNFPVLSIIFSLALPFWIMLISFSVSIYKNNKASIFILLFIFLYFLTLLIGPVYCIRYVYPLLLCIPLMISFPLINSNKDKLNNQKKQIYNKLRNESCIK